MVESAVGPRPASVARVAALAVVALVALAGVAWGAWSLGASPSGVPLPGGPAVAAEANQLSFPRDAASTFSYSVPVVYNRGDDPLRIERVELVGASAGLRVVKVLAAGPRRGPEFVSGDVRFPPPGDQPGDLHPAAGYSVPPVDTPAGSRGIELVLGLTVPRPGHYEMRGVTLEYTVGDRHYRRLLPNTLAVCAVPRGAEFPDECALPTQVEGATISAGKTKVVE